MQHSKLKIRSISISILIPSILAPTLLGFSPISFSAENLELPSLEVSAERLTEYSKTSLNSADTAELLVIHPSINLYQAGGLSALPAICGLNDDRIKFIGYMQSRVGS